MWMVSPAQVIDTSTPGISASPSARAAACASGRPSSTSWSVSASMSTPLARARCTSAVGESVPSERVV